MIPILPLCLFITMNFVAFGNILGLLFLDFTLIVVICHILFVVSFLRVFLKEN
jgi:hypothetical protein